MRKLLWTLLILGLAPLGFAQSTVVGQQIDHGPTLPATCNPGPQQLFFLVNSGPVGVLYQCTGVGTWSAVGSGTGNVTHSAGALTANAIVIGNGAGDITVDPNATLDGSGNEVANSLVLGTGVAAACPSTPTTSTGCWAMTLSGTGAVATTNTIVVQTQTTAPFVQCSVNGGAFGNCGAYFGAGATGSPTYPINPQTTTYQTVASDWSSCKEITVASGTFTITLLATAPAAGQCLFIDNYGSGVVTVAPGGSNTINGSASSQTIGAGSASAPKGMFIVSNAGTAYFAQLLGSGGGGGSSALSAITAASGANTIANGNNGAQVWNWQQTTASQTAFTFGETAASTGVGDQELLVSTFLNSTAVPLVVSNSLSNAQTLPALKVAPTWNTTGVVDAGILENVTNTASGTGSLLMDLQVGGTSFFKVDKLGNFTALGAGVLGANSGTQGSLTLNGSTSGSLVITTPAAAGTPTWTAGSSSGTPAVTVSAPLALATATGNLTITGAAGQVLAGATPAFTATPTLGTDNSVAGTLQEANGSANAHTIWGSAATTTNTIKGFATAPTSGDLVSCTTASTTCTLTDAGAPAVVTPHSIPLTLGVCQGACATGGTAGVSPAGSVITATAPTAYAIQGSTTTPGWGTWQFTTAGAIGTGQAVYYGPLTLPTNYTANSNIVVHVGFADPVAITGNVTWGAAFADVTPPGTAVPTFGAAVNGTATATSGTINNTVMETITFTSPTASPGDQFWFVLFFDAKTGSNNPYLTQLYLSY